MEDKFIPEKIINLISSEEVSSKISDACIKNDVSDEEIIEQFAYFVGQTLAGGLHPEELLSTLKNEIKIETSIIEKVYFELEKNILSLIKNDLLLFYNEPELKKGEPTILIKPEQQPLKSDTYREPIE